MVRFSIIFVFFLALTISLNVTGFRVANAAEPVLFSQALPGYVYSSQKIFTLMMILESSGGTTPGT